MAHPRFSFEVFPAKTSEGETRLDAALGPLSALEPDFISVTYGAGGSVRDRTIGLIRSLAGRGGVPVAGHITCVGASRTEIDSVLRDYWKAGVRRIVALRGDSLDGIGEAYAPHPEGYAFASDLIPGARAIADFDISVGCYPEAHPEARGLPHEIENLKRKFDAGADRAISQFFFEPEIFLRFRDAVADAGAKQPVVPGLMLQPNFKGLSRMASLCGAFIPGHLQRKYEGLDDDRPARVAVTADIVTSICERLLSQGVDAFHFYTMNSAGLAAQVCRNLGFADKQELAS
ncbi:MAG: methylenetetrahydrofolate reductase [Pseudomonadota bacterium]